MPVSPVLNMLAAVKHLDCIVAAFGLLLSFTLDVAAQPVLGNAQLMTYLRAETEQLSDSCLAEIQTAEDWSSRRDDYRRQLQEMLGLWPLPERTDLKAVVTGRLEHEEFTVEKLYFQAMPRLYVTANLFIPRNLSNPAPAILYESGHWRFMTNGVSYGNKAMYQSDGAWFARNGYVCLVLDTVLAGEIQGVHTGTRDRGMWWWNSRGYTPAGVEAWFGIRALDYLSTRPEVDTNRFGITGHSGGGAYSWMVTALDDRIQAAAPLAGMADARSHVLDPVMDSHCDCNFFINYHRWDFPQAAALASPRPLLIGGTDNDRLFNLPNTLRIHEKVRRIYELQKATDRFGLIVAPGGHDEVPELQLAVLRWFNRHLKGTVVPVETAAKRFFAPTDVRVFETLPDDAINTNIASTFVPRAATAAVRTAGELRTALRERVFAGWPAEGASLRSRRVFSSTRDGMRLSGWDFMSQQNVSLRLYILEKAEGRAAERVKLSILDGAGWTNWVGSIAGHFRDELREELQVTAVSASSDNASWERLKADAQEAALGFFAPRGLGLDFWAGDERAQTRIRRRFMLLGQTRDGMRVWDIRRAIQAVHDVREDDKGRISLRADGMMGVNALYAALFEPNIRELELQALPQTHQEGPDYLGVLKVCDIPDVQRVLDGEGR